MDTAKTAKFFDNLRGHRHRIPDTTNRGRNAPLATDGRPGVKPVLYGGEVNPSSSENIKKARTLTAGITPANRYPDSI